MLDLEQFYYEKVHSIFPNDRYRVISEIDDVIIINFDCLFERECAIRGADQLIYQSHQLGQGKRFLFLSEDGTNIRLSGAIEIIKNIIDCFNLDRTTCAIVCRENISIPSATTIISDSIPYWCRVLYPTIKDIPIPQGPFTKKFAVWFHRGTFYRLQLAQHLYEKYPNESFISYQESGMIADRKLAEYFQDDIAWANSHTPIIYDNLFPNRIFNYNMIAGPERKSYNDYFLEVVAETDILSTDWITEKTVKNLYIGKPFIIMGGVGSLECIRSYGFKTFSPWIDETYDTIKNTHLRLEAIKREIDRVAMISIDSIYHELLPILEHNRVTYDKYITSR